MSGRPMNPDRICCIKGCEERVSNPRGAYCREHNSKRYYASYGLVTKDGVRLPKSTRTTPH